jgi:hypothetical protein
MIFGTLSSPECLAISYLAFGMSKLEYNLVALVFFKDKTAKFM